MLGINQWDLFPLWVTLIPTTVLNRQTFTTTEYFLDSMHLQILKQLLEEQNRKTLISLP